MGEFKGPWVALYPAGEVPQYHFHYEIGKRVGLRLILALLKLLLALIRLGKRLKPSERLCAFLPGIYKFRVGLGLVFSACKYIGRGGEGGEEEEGGKEEKGEGKREKKGKKGEAGEVLKEGEKDKGENKKEGRGGGEG